MSYEDKLLENIQKTDKDKSFSGSYRYVVDFASGDPIKDVQAIKADSPVFLTRVVNNGTKHCKLEKAGTIVPKTEKAAQAIKDCFLKDGKLANTRALDIDRNSVLNINGDNVPSNLTLHDGSHLTLEKDAQANRCDLFESNLQLAAGSKIEDTAFEMTNTGKASYDKDNKLHFAKGPAKVQITNTEKTHYISSLINANLSDNCKLNTVTISNATLAASDLDNFIYDGKAFISADLRWQESAKDLLVVSDTTAKDTHVVLTNNNVPSLKTTIINSDLKRTVITGNKNSIDVCDSTVKDSILLDDSKEGDKPQHTVINSSKISGLIMRKPLVADNSSVLAKKDKPIVAFGGLDLTDTHVSTEKGAIIPIGKVISNNITDDLSKDDYRPTNEHYQELADLNKAPVSSGINHENALARLNEKYLIGHKAFKNVVDDSLTDTGKTRDVSEIADAIDKATSTIDTYAKEHAADAAKTAKWAKETSVEL